MHPCPIRWSLASYMKKISSALPALRRPPPPEDRPSHDVKNKIVRMEKRIEILKLHALGEMSEVIG
jgi:hypothetical protein